MRHDAHGGGCVCWHCTYRDPHDAPASAELLADPMGTLREQLERAKPWPEERRKAEREAARQEARA